MMWLTQNGEAPPDTSDFAPAPAKEPSLLDRLLPPAQLAPLTQPTNEVELAKPLEGAIDEIASPGFLHRLGQNIGAQFAAGIEVDNSTADLHAQTDAYQHVVDQVNKHRSADAQLTNPMTEDAQLVALENASAGLAAPPPFQPFAKPREELEAELWSAVAALKKQNPGAAASLPATPGELEKLVRENQRGLLGQAQAIAQDSGPVARNVGGFLGKGAAGFEDPVNLMAMGSGAPAASGLLRTFLIEGALNAGADALQMPSRFQRYGELGVPPPSAGDIAGELGADVALGGSLPVGLKLAGRGLDHLVHAFDTSFPNAGDNARAARNAAADMARRAADNPHAGTDEGRDLYRADLQKTAAAADLRAALPDTFSLSPGARAADLAADAAKRRQGYALQSFRTSELSTDAATMQYKRGGDASGVTDRLKGAEAWDPVSAGVITVWEKTDGSHVVANGHQRLGLAQALEANGHPAIDLNAIVRREADGYTARDMRVEAALTNIREGSGEAIDAARVLKEAPDQDVGLPPRSLLVRRARDLANLKGDAWDMAWNGVVSERDAALVGRHTGDPAMQTAILGYLKNAAPDSEQEAELMVRQALAAGARKQVQTDMFGSMLKADLVLPERVAILHSALNSLRKDKALFATLTKRGGAIEAAGNVLNPEENLRRQETAAQAFATISALASRKGEISDALQAAAERSLAGHDRAGATRDFLAHVRGQLESGRIQLGGSGDHVGAVGPAPEAALAAERAGGTDGHAALEDFAEPAKREAFDNQARAIARELSPPEENKISRGGRGAAEAAPGADNLKKEFGEALPEIEALRALPQDLAIADQDQFGLFGREDKPVTVKTVRAEIEREARAVERLRNCLGERAR